MSVLNRQNFDTKEQLALSLADETCNALCSGIEENGRASLAVSGGSTPALFFAKLSEREIDWSKVTVTLVDERWVDEADSRSNARLVKEKLLNGLAGAATFVPLFTGDETPEEGTLALEDRLAASVSFPLDAVILGMGTDGHTASFFPGGDQLDVALDGNGSSTVVAMRADGAGEPRITFTLPVLLAANHLVLHIEGNDKQDVLAKALEEGPVEDMPIRAVLKGLRTKPTHIVWAP